MDIKPVAAIYKLENSVTGEFYIGVTRNAQGRKRQHFYDLRKGRHHNPKLQRDYNLGHTFLYWILEYLDNEMSDDTLVRREQQWVDMLHPTYNSRNAILLYGSDLELSKERKLSGKVSRKQTDEEKQKRAMSVKEYWETHPPKIISDEHKRRISEKMRGSNHHNYGKETPIDVREKIANSGSKIEYTLKYVDGTIEVFRNLTAWSLKHGITHRRMHLLCSGVTKSCDGWVFISKRKID